MFVVLVVNLCDNRYNWCYYIEVQQGLDGCVLYWLCGCVWGGFLFFNVMVYVCGYVEDYECWQCQGVGGWDYVYCLFYFCKVQGYELGVSWYWGVDGLLWVFWGKINYLLYCVFLEVVQQVGYLFIEDMNGFQQEGFGWMDMIIYEGKWWSVVCVYLYLVLSCINFKVEVQIFVSRVLFEGICVVGVEYVKNGQSYRVYVSKEVILSGGVINFLQLFMFFGIGNVDDFKKLGIFVVCYLFGVGQNL